MVPIEPNTPCLIDTHVHLHQRYEVGAYLDAVDANLERASIRAQAHQRAASGSERSSHTNSAQTARCHSRLVSVHRILLLADPLGWSSIDRLLSCARRGRWSVERGAEPGVAVASAPDSHPLIFIGGHQRNTAEGLELLVPASAEPISDGLPLDDALDAARALGTTPIVPWGFGKWWGRRGRVLRGLIDRSEPGALLLGDNAGRPRALPPNPLFVRARARGIATLPGSDPLDLNGHLGRAGSFGLVWQGQEDGARTPRLTTNATPEPMPDPVPPSRGHGPAWAHPVPGFDPAHPMSSLRAILSVIRPEPQMFGRRTGLATALLDQINLRLGR